MNKQYSTKDIAEATGVHPNTVRLYEKWGFLPPVPRARNGYRVFGEAHLKQMKLSRIALPGPYPGGSTCVYELVKESAFGNFKKALELAFDYLDIAGRELKAAHKAADLLESWVYRREIADGSIALNRRETACAMQLSIDTLRTWERNGLLRIKNSSKGHKMYGSYELGRLKIIRLLRFAGYSIASILRMFYFLDQGITSNLKEILNTPDPEEDICYVADQLITTLSGHVTRAKKLIAVLEKRIKE